MPELTTKLLSVVGLGAIAGLTLLLLSKLNFRWASLLVGAMVFFSAIATAVDFYENPYITIIAPLSDNRSFLYMVCGLGLAAMALINGDKFSLRDVTPTAWFCFFLSIWGALIQTAHDGLQQGLQSLAFAAATLVPLSIAVGGLIKKWGDWVVPLRCIAFATAIWTALTAYQFYVDRRMVMLGNENRFIGLSANPQHTAAFLACAGNVVLYLALTESVKLFRLLWIAQMGAIAIMLFWTGSRTGLGMMAVGASVILYARIGRMILVMPFVAVAAYVLFKFLSQDLADVNTARLTSSNDTRTAMWKVLVDQYVENPMIGIGTGRSEASENGYLLGAATYGSGFVIIQFIATFCVAAQAISLWRVRTYLVPKDRALVDLILATFLSFFAGSMFEGYFAARIAASVVVLAMLSVVGGRVTRLIREAAEQEQAAAEWYAANPEFEEAAAYPPEQTGLQVGHQS
jgi:hypothetical protein